MNTKWKEYLGYAVHDLADSEDPDNHVLEVLCPDFFPFEQNLVQKEAVKSLTTVKDGFGTRRKKDTTMINTIKARYLGTGTVVSVPDIVTAERVRVLRYGNSKLWFWLPYGNDVHLRQNEHYAIRCANQKLRLKVLDDENTYQFIIDTRDDQKQITLMTGKTDGEVFSYLFQMNPTTKSATLTDDIGNRVLMESEEHKMVLENASGVSIKQHNENMHVVVPGNLTLDVGKGYHVQYASAKELGDIKETVISNQSVTGDVLVLASAKIALDGLVSISKMLQSAGVLAPIMGSAGPPPPGTLAKVDIPTETKDGSDRTTPDPETVEPTSDATDNTSELDGQRRTVAWEEFKAAMDLVLADLTTLNTRSGAGVSPVGVPNPAIAGLVDQAIMLKNKGE